MKTRNAFKYAGFGLLGIAGVFAFTFVVMWLWNWLVPELFHGPVLGYWQTLGLLILSKILFSGIGGGHGDKSSYSRRQRCNDDYPKSKWRQKYEAKMNGKTEKGEGQDDVIIAE
ncbi:MAG: hypothetical protein V2B15_21270 [Bacteroidota bacterium]